MQTAKIIVRAVDVWDYFQKNKTSIGEKEHIIAENEEFGVIISLTKDNESPCFIVTADDYQYAEERAISENDCKTVVSNLYDYYLTEKFLSGDDSPNEEDESLLDQEDMITQREEELDEAVVLFLSTVMEDDICNILGEDTDSVCEDFKDHALEYLYRKHEISPRRPMILEDEETKEDFFEEYPYESMIFEDKYNPLYKK